MNRFVAQAPVAMVLLSLAHGTSGQMASPSAEALVAHCSQEIDATAHAFVEADQSTGRYVSTFESWQKTQRENAVQEATYILQAPPTELDVALQGALSEAEARSRTKNDPFYERALVRACLTQARINSLPQGASDAGKRPEPPSSSECGAEQSASINSALDAIDQRVARFLESPAGRQNGAATPSLQVVMWGTRQQAEVMQNCANTAAFSQRVAELDAAFDSAKRACIQIQSGGRTDVCGPVAPENLQ